MKHYLKRLLNALKGKNYYPYYHEDEYPLVWELDEYIVNLVRVNLPNYKCGYPASMKKEERDDIQNELIDLANKLHKGEVYRFKNNEIEEKQLYTRKEFVKYRKRFGVLLGKHMRDLRD